MEVLCLKSQGLPHGQICQLAGIYENRLRAYLRDYQQEEIEKLKEIKFYQPKSELEAHRITIFVLTLLQRSMKQLISQTNALGL